ncbi:hypothetical protein [Natrarchaeobaculum sulfurireducens]|uniref:Uncharacterized protein n=1 Tax=Natrarchaeobaculum sulfurireducens TaxID=2044521 RepID=A0A346PMG5_9EURY|nr:hypothetical protein [Natrarchaeobaculum sulfurireducens]AXR80710.1 hypothetical protein AArcMg_0688 [Natrarchaeobaculum sulfurireducens]
MERRSLAYLVLVSAVTLAVGSLIWIVFNETMTLIFDQPTYEPEHTDVESDPIADDLIAGQRYLRWIWEIAPALAVVAVAVTALIKARM